MNRTLSGATAQGRSGPESDGNEGVRCIPQSSSITGATTSNCLNFISRTLIGVEVLRLNRDAVGVFYSPNRLGKNSRGII